MLKTRLIPDKINFCDKLVQKFSFLYIISFTFVFFSAHAGADTSWIAKVRTDHPRIFFNSNTWQEVRNRALNQEKEWCTPSEQSGHFLPFN